MVFKQKMSKNWRRTLHLGKLISLLVSLILFVASPFSAAAAVEETNISKYIDRTLTEMVNQEQVKGAVASVVINRVDELCKGYGFADEENNIAASEDSTAFRIGSISKTFVAIAAQQLVQEGKLDMNASIMEYLEDDFPSFTYDITMKHLLTHTAGFEDMLTGIAAHDIDKAEPLELSIRKYMPAQVFEPGEVISYSNYGIALAAYVIERITGQDFYLYADTKIFKPLGMTKTSFELDYAGVAVSKAYSRKGNEVHEPFINLYPEGSVVSTAADMAKYMRWLMDDSDVVLNVDAKKELFEQHFTMAEEFEGMGYTWNRKERNGFMYYDKKGETVNFYSRIVLYPQQKTGVFLSFNTYVDENQINSIMDGITELILGPKKSQKIYNGKQTADISGYYIPTRSSFTNIERLMNFLTPNKIMHISGTVTDGFKMNGQELLPIGENYYSTPIGNLKYIEKNGRAYLANNTAIAYVRIHWYESGMIQMLVAAMFAVLSLLVAAAGIMRLSGRRKDRKEHFISVLSIIHCAWFIVMCCLIFTGLSNFNLLSYSVPIRIFALLVATTSVGGILYTAYLLVRKVFKPDNILLIAWNISSLLFCLWMVQVNIL